MKVTVLHIRLCGNDYIWLGHINSSSQSAKATMHLRG